MATYAEALLRAYAGQEGPILRQEALTEMWSPQFSPNPRIPGMGLAFFVHDFDGRRVVGAMTETARVRIRAAPRRDDRAGVVMLINTATLSVARALSPLRGLRGGARLHPVDRDDPTSFELNVGGMMVPVVFRREGDEQIMCVGHPMLSTPRSWLWWRSSRLRLRALAAGGAAAAFALSRGLRGVGASIRSPSATPSVWYGWPKTWSNTSNVHGVLSCFEIAAIRGRRRHLFRSQRSGGPTPRSGLVDRPVMGAFCAGSYKVTPPGR